MSPRIHLPVLMMTLLLASAPCWTAEFGLATTIRAGRADHGDWELGIGPTGNNAAVTAHLDPPNYYPEIFSRRFEIGYQSATNSAFLRYFYSPWAYRQVSWAAGGPGLGAGAVWTIPTASLFVSAAGRPNTLTAIWIEQLALGGGVQVLQPFSSTTLLAWQFNSNMTTGITSPVSFRTGASGDWLLSGRIAFLGLAATIPGGAQRSQLQMIANISGVSAPVPEPAVEALLGSGLVGLALLKRRLKRRGGTAK